MPSSLRHLRHVAAVLTAAMLLAGCSGEPPPTPEELASEAAESRFAACGRLSDDIAGTLQRYIDQFAPETDAVDGSIGSAAPSAEDLQVAAVRFRERRAVLGCEAREFQLQLTLALETLEGAGPIARAVVAEVRDSVLASTGPAPNVMVAVGDDVLDAVHGAQAGSTIELAAGRHVIDEPLVLLRGTTLRGAGSAETSLVSAAAGGVIIHLGTEQVTMSGITVAHEGDEVASVMVLSTGSYDLDDVVVTGGVADEEQASGWGLVLGGGGAYADLPDGAGEPVERLVGVEARDNGAGGVAVVEDRAPAISGLTASGNATCGICYLGAAGGTLAGGTFEGNDLGISFAASAAPVIEDVVVTGNTGVGILAQGEAAPVVTGVEVTGNALVGVGVQQKASLVLSEGEVADHGEVGVLVEGDGTLTIGAVVLRGTKVGVLTRDASSATIGDVTLRELAEGGLVFGGSSSGSVDGPTCEGDLIGIVLLEDADPEIADEGSCTFLDQR